MRFSFNPHPLRRADAAPESAQVLPTPAELSILIRSEERMLPEHAMASPEDLLTFNPHPLRRADAAARDLCSDTVLDDFQSSSAPKSGCCTGNFRARARIMHPSGGI